MATFSRPLSADEREDLLRKEARRKKARRKKALARLRRDLKNKKKSIPSGFRSGGSRCLSGSPSLSGSRSLSSRDPTFFKLKSGEMMMVDEVDFIDLTLEDGAAKKIISDDDESMPTAATESSSLAAADELKMKTGKTVDPMMMSNDDDVGDDRDDKPMATEAPANDYSPDDDDSSVDFEYFQSCFDDEWHDDEKKEKKKDSPPVPKNSAPPKSFVMDLEEVPNLSLQEIPVPNPAPKAVKPKRKRKSTPQKKVSKKKKSVEEKLSSVDYKLKIKEWVKKVLEKKDRSTPPSGGTGTITHYKNWKAGPGGVGHTYDLLRFPPKGSIEDYPFVYETFGGESVKFPKSVMDTSRDSTLTRWKKAKVVYIHFQSKFSIGVARRLDLPHYQMQKRQLADLIDEFYSTHLNSKLKFAVIRPEDDGYEPFCYCPLDNDDFHIVNTNSIPSYIPVSTFEACMNDVSLAHNSKKGPCGNGQRQKWYKDYGFCTWRCR